MKLPFTILLVCIAPGFLFSQEVQRQTISGAGGSMNHQGIVVQQTVGQPYHTGTSKEAELAFRPGFLQPQSIKVEPVISLMDVMVYPNPTAHFITIECKENTENAFITVNDVSGKLMMSENLKGQNKLTIPCSNWADGIYLMSISQNNTVLFSSKLTIAK